MTQSTAENSATTLHDPLANTAESGGCGCNCGTPEASEVQGSEAGARNATNATPIRITIDGQDLEVAPEDKNIVDVATRAKIAIPAACYRAGRSKGCCHGCVVEIGGEQKFSCATPPEDGMNVVVDREDLKAIRKKNLLAYKEGIESGNPCKCSVAGSGSC